MSITTGTVNSGFEGGRYSLRSGALIGSPRRTGAAAPVVQRVALILLCLTAISSARGADGLLLTAEPDGAPGGWLTAPPLDRMVWQPDRLLRTGSRTIDAAAETLVAGLLADPEAPDWLRLEAFDLTAVGDCETCQPPPLDPHRYSPLTAPVALDPRQYTFFVAVAERLGGTRFRPLIIVPAGGEPSPVPLPDNLTVLLAGPGGPAAFTPEVLAARAEQAARWQAAGFHAYNLLSDGLGEFYGLPLNGDLLRRQAVLPYPAVAVRDAATFAAVGPDWLTARLTAVVVHGETTPEGDVWRADDPRLATAVDVFAPVSDQLGEAAPERLAAATLRALEAIRAWDVARAGGRPSGAAGVVGALTERAELRGGWESHGPLSEAFAAFVAAAEPLPHLALGPVPGVTIDGFVSDEEWRGATRVELATGADGQPSARPATVWLAADAEALSLAVVATEPDPADATLADRLVLRLSDGASGMLRLELPVGQVSTMSRWTLGASPSEAEPLRGLLKEAVFDGPGWVLEVRLTWASLDVEPGSLRAMGLATEHRAGSLRAITNWCPDGGGEQRIERLARVRVR